MTNNSKETERAELHKTIWRIANDLRGSVDGWDFKSYVLGMLFYRFISENLTGYLNEQERRAGNAEFDYTTLSDKDAEFGRAETVREKGFYILPSELFANVRSKARQDANLNETLSRIFVDIEASAKGSDSEYDFKGLFDDLDVNSSKLGPTVAKRNEKLVKLLDAIGELDLVIVVNMFLTGFDATTLNTLWVDKNLKAHGLIQAYSRTNRILNSVKTYGNIVSFRNLEDATNDALALFGNKDAKGIVLLKPYAEYYAEYQGKIAELQALFPLGAAITGEAAQKAFIKLFGAILRLKNILTAFDDFAGNEILSQRDFQDYQSVYLNLYAEFRAVSEAEKESIRNACRPFLASPRGWSAPLAEARPGLPARSISR